MNEYRHHVAGFFPGCDEARKTWSAMAARGMLPEQMRIIAASASDATEIVPA